MEFPVIIYNSKHLLFKKSYFSFNNFLLRLSKKNFIISKQGGGLPKDETFSALYAKRNVGDNTVNRTSQNIVKMFVFLKKKRLQVHIQYLKYLCTQRHT